jgi:site-specific DNA recombinase
MTTTAAAIYARLSKQQQRGENQESESVERQIENATAFAVERGWTVAKAHIFSDDGISGAEFEKRPGFMRLMAAATRTPKPFQVLIVSEQKSIGREMSETSMVIKQLAQAGVEIFEYGRGQSLTPKNFMDKMVAAFRAGADEAHREDTAKRVHEAHDRKVRMGYVVGGRCYGYRNVDVFSGTDEHGRPRRSHVVREVDPTQARVIRQIFELSGTGHGLKAIAKILNASGIATPRGARMWRESTVRAVLFNETYRGVVVWNRTRKRDDWGQVAPRDRDQHEWRRVPAPKLEIVKDQLWRRAHEQLALRSRSYLAATKGERHGRPPVNGAARHRHLLTGYTQCVCGSRLEVRSRWHGSPGHRSRRVNFLVCAAHVRRGDTSCTNHRMIPMLAANEAVLAKIEEKLLTPEFIERTLAAVMRRFPSRADVDASRATIEGRLRKVQAELNRLVEKFADSGSATYAAAITRRETELQHLQQELTRIDRQPVQLSSGMASRIEAMARRKIAEFKRLMRTQTPVARRLLALVLRGRISFTPQRKGTQRGFRWDADAHLWPLLSGIIPAGSAGGTSPTGFEPVFWP